MELSLKKIFESALQELLVKGDRSADAFIAFRQHLWLVDSGDIEFSEEIEQVLGLEEGSISEIHDIVDSGIYEEAKYHDLIVGTLHDGDMYIWGKGSFTHSPESSPAIKKIAKEVGANNVSYSGYLDGDDMSVATSQVRGKIPDVVYHGTSTRFMDQILKKGLVPNVYGGQDRGFSNYPNVVTHSDKVFFTSKFDEAVHHAMNATKQGDDPVIIQLKIPDKDRVQPDFDVTNYINPKDPETKKKTIHKNAFKATVDLGIYAYKGRIPSSFFTKFFIMPWFEGEYPSSTKDFRTVDKGEMEIYIDTKEEYGLGVFDWEDVEEFDDEDDI